MIYFLQGADGGPVKIGHTINLESRMRSLKTTTGFVLVVLGVMDGAYEDEQRTHDIFSNLRLRPSRACEWFLDDPALMAFIAEHSRPWHPSDDVEAPQRFGPFAVTHAYAKWVDYLKDQAKGQADSILDEALAEWAERRGLIPPPPRLPSTIEQRNGLAVKVVL